MTTFDRLPAASSATGFPSLESFREAARQGTQVHISQDGSQWNVLATGVTPSNRQVAWIESDAPDTTSAFLGALGQSFSRGIHDAVARELGLGPAPGQPLSSHTVIQAIDMAETSRSALGGVDFLTQLHFSAVSQGPGFVEVSAAAGVSTLDAGQRAAVDAHMQARFSQAAEAGQVPVTQEAAREWLRQELATLLS